MIAKYVELLKSFKKHQISQLIEKISDRIIIALNSPWFNTRIEPFFPQPIVLPFTDFELDPANISQIKKIMNALYYLRLTFIDLEQLNFQDVKQASNDLQELYTKTIHQAYLACLLLTHLDVDLPELFREECAVLIPILNNILNSAKNHSEIAHYLQDFPLSNQAGMVTGTTVKQMQPNRADLDYTFLTTFSADLPDHIAQLTHYLRENSLKILENTFSLNSQNITQFQNEPILNQKIITDLKNQALELLFNLEQLKNNGLFFSLKFLKYIHIVRTLITLSMSSLEQMGHLSQSSQDVIRDNLTQLKYKLLPELFTLVDKIEVHTMLKPGALSTPLMVEIKKYYQVLIHYASKPVNFAEKGEELLSIEDWGFLNLRLAGTEQRIKHSDKVRYKLHLVQEAFTQFFNILSNPDYTNVTLTQLPTDVIKQLLFHYKLISPYMAQVDYDLNNTIIYSLQHPSSIGSYFSHYWRVAIRVLPMDHLSYILATKKDVQRLIEKKCITEQFVSDLNHDLAAAVKAQTDLVLFPYTSHHNPFSMDESQVFKLSAEDHLAFISNEGNKFIANSASLTAEQAYDLYQWYEGKNKRLIEARKHFTQFLTKLTELLLHNTDPLPFQHFSDEVIEQLRSSYILFQDYYIAGTPSYLHIAVLRLDRYLVHNLTHNADASPIRPLYLFAQLDAPLKQYFTAIEKKWTQKSHDFLKMAQQKFTLEQHDLQLEQDKNNRAHYLIQHTYYSQFIKDFRATLTQYTVYLNTPMQVELKQQSSGIPYPELQNKDTFLAQGKQVLAIKQLFNCMYHIEQIIIELEKLSNKSTESIYIYHLLQIYSQINQIIDLSKKLNADPHVHLIARELVTKAKLGVATIIEHSDAYATASTAVDLDGEVHCNPIWYTLNALFHIPQHIRALTNQNNITPEELSEIQQHAKKASLTIEKLIKDSNSYFKLFLQTPKMYRLYQDLNTKLNEFITTTHDSVMNNVTHIQTTFLNPMLLEADFWEYKFGLKPGVLTDPLQKIVTEFFTGFIFSVGIEFKMQLALFSDETPLQQRIDQTQQKINKIQNDAIDLKEKYAALVRLYNLMNNYFELITEDTESTLIKTYKEVLPQLNKLQKKLALPISEESTLLDDILNQSIKSYQPKLTHISSLIQSSYHYYCGIETSIRLNLKNAQQQLNYLTSLKKTPEQYKKSFIDQYTVYTFNTELRVLAAKHVGLHYTGREYSNKLHKFVQLYQTEIIQAAKNAPDINQNIKSSIQKRIAIFEQHKFASHYQLETVCVALAQFTDYFDRTAKEIKAGHLSTENETILAKKAAKITYLNDIATNKSWTIPNRIKKIKEIVDTDEFHTTILESSPIKGVHLTYLKQCLLKLLEALHLYTPKRKKLVANLEQAIKQQPKFVELSKRFGLFAVKVQKEKEQEQEQRDFEINLTNTAAASA